MKAWQITLLIIGAALWLSWFMEHCTNHIMGGLRALERKIDSLEAERGESDEIEE